MKVCGLTYREMVDLIGVLKALDHAVQEGDWDRIESMSLHIHTGYIDRMDAADCRFPPHHMFTAGEKLQSLESCIRLKKADCALGAMLDLGVGLLQEIFEG